MGASELFWRGMGKINQSSGGFLGAVLLGMLGLQGGVRVIEQGKAYAACQNWFVTCLWLIGPFLGLVGGLCVRALGVHKGKWSNWTVGSGGALAGFVVGYPLALLVCLLA